MEIERTPAAGVIDKGHDWRAEIGTRDNAGLSVDLARAREPGRGREATTPEQIPPRGWRDILWRVFWSISEDRILSTSGSVAFFALLAVFPGIAAIVSLYGLFADASTIGKHLSLLSGFLPEGVLGRSPGLRDASEPFPRGVGPQVVVVLGNDGHEQSRVSRPRCAALWLDRCSAPLCLGARRRGRVAPLSPRHAAR